MGTSIRYSTNTPASCRDCLSFPRWNWKPRIGTLWGFGWSERLGRSANAAGNTRRTSAASRDTRQSAPPAPGPSTSRGMPDRRMLAFLGAAGVFALDRLTKWIVETRFTFFDIVRSQNRGVAFGILNDSASPWSTVFLIAAALAAVPAIATLLWRADRKMDARSVWGLALILGGAAGNVFDRIVWGRVTDFLLLYVRDWQWPTFNLADSAIVAGSALLIFDLLRSSRRSASHVS